MSISARMIECPLCREKAQAVEDLSELRRVYTCPIVVDLNTIR